MMNSASNQDTYQRCRLGTDTLELPSFYFLFQERGLSLDCLYSVPWLGDLLSQNQHSVSKAHECHLPTNMYRVLGYNRGRYLCIRIFYKFRKAYSLCLFIVRRYIVKGEILHA